METKNRNKNGKAFSIIWGLFLIATMVGCSKSDPTPDPLPEPLPTPTITGIDPTVGPIGTEVTISGANFSGTANENVISFNGSTSVATSASPTQLKALVPQNATSGAVSVTVNGKQAQGPSFTIFEGNAYNCANKEILEDTIWEDIVPGDGVDYVIQCEIVVKGTALLTIEPGVVIAFEGETSGIFTSEGGGVKAVGTVADPIIFKGTSDNLGVWKGMYFATNHPENRLEYVTVKNAGRTASAQSQVKGAVQLTRGADAKASIVNCTVVDNDGYGIFITDESNLATFSGNTITNNVGAPVGLFFNQMGDLDTDSEYMGNGKDYIEIRANDIADDDVAMALLDVPYRFVESKKYNINKALSIAPGNILEFTSGAGFRLGEQASDCITATGSLDATGTAGNPIVFRGITAGKGTWLGLGFNSSSPNNKLIYCDISGGGSGNLYNGSQFAANVTLQCEARVSIQNTTISDSGGFGIYMLDEDTKLGDFKENSLVNNELAPILIHLPQVDQLDTASTYADGNGRAYIQVMGQSIKDADLTMADLGLPYRIGKSRTGTNPYVEKALTILPGVVLEFEPSIGIVLGHPSFDCTPLTGSLHAEGTLEEPIIFRGLSAGQGSWLGIGINSNASANLLKYCEVIGGGGSQMYNAGGQGNVVIHCSGSLSLENCTIADSGGWGVDFVQGGNSLVNTNNTFANNVDGNVAPN